jgi:hypothetical protein
VGLEKYVIVEQTDVFRRWAPHRTGRQPPNSDSRAVFLARLGVECAQLGYGRIAFHLRNLAGMTDHTSTGIRLSLSLSHTLARTDSLSSSSA